MRLKDSCQTQYVFLQVERKGRRISDVGFQTPGICHAGERAFKGSHTLKAHFIAILGETLLHSTIKVAPKVIGNCLLLRQVIGVLMILSRFSV